MSSLRKHKEGSIVVTVLILMVVSSFLVLLTMRYVLSMLSGFTSLTNYYKAYYLARGGMDVLLTQHSYRGWGYETTFESDVSSFQCAGKCGVAGSIESRFPRIDTSKAPTTNECSADNGILLQPGQSAVHALFSDTYDLPDYFVPLQPLIDYQNFASNKNVDMYLYNDPIAGKLYWYDSRDGAFGSTYLFEPDFSQFAHIPGTSSDKRKTNILATVPNRAGVFLVIHNPSVSVDARAKPFRYCFSSPDENIIGQTNIIRTRAFVNNADVTLETVKTNRFPSILVQ